MGDVGEIGPDISSDIEEDLRCDNIAEKDVSDEEIEAEDLERRMWKDRIKLKRLKERQKLEAQQAAEKQKPKQTTDQARRKKMSRAQDGILKYMLKLMEVCKARGFVYGIIPEKGKPVSGASDNIRAWWKEKVKFDKNGPAAIAKHEADSDNGTSGITEMPQSGHGEKQGAASSNSDYDVDGTDDGVGSVSSSKDDRRNQVMDVDPSSNLHNNARNNVQDKDQCEKKPRRKSARVRASPVKQRPAPSHNEHLHVPTRGALPDINHTDVQMIGLQVHENQQENGAITTLRPLENDLDVQAQRPAPELNYYPGVPSGNVITTQGMHVGGTPLLYHGVRDADMHHGDTFNQHHGDTFSLYNPSTQYPPSHDRQPPQIVMNEPQIIPADGVHVPVHRNGSEIAGGDLPNFVQDTFQSEQDRTINANFGSPIDSLSLDYGLFNSPFNFGIDGTGSLDDLELDEMMEYFAA
ncbi:hypothetical protein C1H46_014513 [Malus baccata]|uniref:Ethylene insensitive 3-like DNA-binding domain-containing protein n=1 Tax=Malus baccata TaxID=106549 RepID=A0A540MM85_MALBA|nr:hypothetical protein C1H46_014513 [Malus baccata]